jgi:hypothetical protein
MKTGLLYASIVFCLTGVATVYAGHRIRTDERTDLVFAPGVDAPDREVARASGRVTVLAGIATVVLGVGVLFVEPNARGWILLLVPYTVVCLGSAFWMRWQLSARTRR